MIYLHILNMFVCLLSWYLSDDPPTHTVMCYGSGAERRLEVGGGGCRCSRRRGVAAGRLPRRPRRFAAGVGAAAAVRQLQGVRNLKELHVTTGFQRNFDRG